MVIGMLQVFFINTYTLLEVDATFSIVTPFVAMKFKIFHKVLLEPFSVSIMLGESLVANKVYRIFPIILSYKSHWWI